MKIEKEDNYSLAELFQSVREFFQFLFRKWILLLLAIVVGLGLGLLYYTIQKPKYKAVNTFILEDKAGGGGGLAGLASQFGFNLGSLGSGSSIFSGDNIINILKSKKVIEHVLLSRIEEPGLPNTTLADLYLDFSELRKKWEQKQYLKGISFIGQDGQLTPLQDSVLNVIYEGIVKKNLSTERISKQGTIIKVEVIAAHPAFARLLAERLSAEASRFYLELRVGTAQENIRQLQRRSDSLLLLLNRKSYTAAASQPLDINPGLRTAIVPVEIANRDKTVLATLYAEVTKNLEASKLILSQQMPVIQQLDRPGYLLEDNKKSLVFLLIAGAMVTAVLYTLGAFLIFQLKGIKKTVV